MSTSFVYESISDKSKQINYYTVNTSLNLKFLYSASYVNKQVRAGLSKGKKMICLAVTKERRKTGRAKKND